MIKVKKTGLKQKQQRMRMLPEYLTSLAMTASKKLAVQMIGNFKDGIIKNNFRLTPLEEVTKQQKKKKGAPAPNRPLWGVSSLDDPSSLKNSLRIKKLKTGYKVFPSWAKHHESGLTLRDLLSVHEYGRSISTGNAIIVIPPRPAFRKAFERTIKQQQKISSKELSQALTKLINENKKDYLKKQQEQAEKDKNKLGL